ncbi:hypothetical protein C5748_24825 [Phyllobacterium phragmitis]|uniref:Holin n=1 Tax=Phyllobacterium phragmitis TaxID=2670329 RepID=A0A2S9IK35_9HYPH|nr:hypothetical protein [Phyllobacterium phragmitis]PRD40862.1 hypothetical protein C5748_24825 [Phyllobacterium phragmitis]
MKIDLIIPILRQLLQVIGGALIARGYLDQGAADALSGLVINGLALGWWLFDRHRINRRMAETMPKAGEAPHA